MINQLQEKYQLSLLLLLGSLAVMGVLPFVFIRYLEGNYISAMIDMTLIIGIITIIFFAYYTKKIRLIGALSAGFINAGVVTIVVANGIDSYFWVYPVFASTFILVKPIEAFCLNMVAAVSLNSFVATILMLSISAFIYASHGLKQFRLLEQLNSVDPLTGALNRRALSEDMQLLLSVSEHKGGNQLLAMVDMDYFKKVNDQYGHAVGDQVLKEFVSIIQLHVGKNDRLYRFGGEEFVLLITDVGDHQIFIDKLRSAIKKDLKTPDGREITVSLGVALWVSGTTADSWLQRADDALYQAKASGRDCAVYNIQ